MVKLLGSISYVVLIPAAILLGIAPFGQEPHLVEKLRMLAGGTLTRPLDIFDLLMHLSPTVLLVAKVAVDVIRRARRQRQGAN